MVQTLLTGITLRFRANPLQEGPDAAVIDEHGGVLVEDGRIAAVGTADDLSAAHPAAARIDHGRGLVLPGFVDAHAHYSQTAIIASWGKRLIDWLNTYTFPEEARFADPDYAAQIADRYLDLCLANGITTAASYCTVHPASVDALLAAAKRRGLAWIAGKVMMDRNAPENICDTAETAYADSKSLIDRWHGVDRLGYAITPRFAPTSSAAQLDAAGTLWAKHPYCLMQTHLSEQAEEITWVRDLFPEARDYLDVYAHFGLTGPGAVMGHAIHLSEREWRVMAETGTAIAHCPTSNTFIGSGLFDAGRAAAMGIATGLATDVGGGSSFSMLRTMAAAYEIAQLRGRALHAAELIWLATAGSADALRISGRIGRLEPGFDADIVVLDLASTPVIAQRAKRATSIWDAIFATLMLGDDRAITKVYIAGQSMRA